MSFRNYDVEECRNCGFREDFCRVICRRCGRRRHFPPRNTPEGPKGFDGAIANQGPNHINEINLNKDPFDDGPPGGAAGMAVQASATEEEINDLVGNTERRRNRNGL